MELSETISRFAVALGIGLLIGLERGWRTREQEPGSRTAGVRTFTISALFGGVAGSVGNTFGGAAGGAVAGLALLAYAMMITIFCLQENRADKIFSATTAIAATLTFSLGMYALVGNLHVTAAVAVAAVIILALRESLHEIVARITWPELRSGLALLAMTFIALPIMPDNPIGPYGGINPRELWLVAIVLAAVSFFGYVAIKYLGATHGVLIAAAAGGLASSTAVTIANARRAANDEAPARLLAAGVALASAVMFLRVCFIILALNPALAPLALPSLITAAVTAVVFAFIPVIWKGSEGAQDNEIKLRNPFSFWAVFGFAILLAVMIPAGRAVTELTGATGAIVGAAIVGIADVDAITVSMTRLAPEPLTLTSATLAILAAVSTDTISKIGIGAVIGRGAFAWEIALMALGCHITAAIALWFVFS